MNGIERQAVFYRGYLVDERSLAPLTRAFAAIVGLWLLVYAISAIDPPPRPHAISREANASSLASHSP